MVNNAASPVGSPVLQETSNPNPKKNNDLVELPSEYQKFIHLSRYSRYKDDLGRRETWGESVRRYFDFFDAHVNSHSPKAIKEYRAIREELEHAVLNLEVMPSMRALMTAGKALERDHVAGYNCSFIPCDSPRAFDEAMYILMCGTGVGFSVENFHISKLPIISEEFQETDTTIMVPDSKMGWAVSFRELIAMLYAGRIPKWDLRRLRPAGSRLKTMGGRSSGPEPLDALFNFACATFKNAAGRKLTSLECHDLMCKIADVIVVGGVRRSALISLSDLNDQQLRNAKSGKWWETAPQRALANNSASYNGKPDMETFMREWLALVESKSGERGIFNLEAARKHASSNGRRDGKQINGTNPCSLSADTLLFTTSGPKEIQSLEGKPFVAYVNGLPYRAKRGSWISGKKELFRLDTSEGFTLNLTADHRVMTDDGWKEVATLVAGDKISICYQDDISWDGSGTFDEGFLLGMFVSDGNFSKGASKNAKHFGQLKVWRKENGFESLKNAVVESIHKTHPHTRKNSKDICDYARSAYVISNIGKLPQKFGISPDKKHDIRCLENTSSEFQIGFLRGFFDGDGHIEGNSSKGYSIRVAQSDYQCLQVVQRMLARLGIFSKIRNLKDAGLSLLPDGKGARKWYRTKKSWRLIISGSSTKRYMERIGFANEEKVKKAQPIFNTNHYVEKFFATFLSLTSLGVHDVWDAEVDEVFSFDANGFHTHNSEILLRSNEFCNLSEVVVRGDDTVKSLKRKIRIATILGTLQATLVDFRYLRKVWKTNAEDEALLGVSMTGIMDNEMLATNNEKLPAILQELKSVAIETNKEWAKTLGIKQSAGISCVKPAGTTSQLTDSASGIHARHSRFYIRTVRADKKDPLARMMVQAGFPVEDDVTKPDSVYVFSFPIESPPNAVLRNELTAIQQLEIWKTYALNWCEHKPSVTISVKESEWLEVGAWVYKNFDTMSGVSFLPYADHIYKQAPYQEITEAQYKELAAKMPKADWGKLIEFEHEDNTTGTQTLSCTGGSCEIVDLTS